MSSTPFGKFLLKEMIASGGMAEIFKAVGMTVAGTRQGLAIKRILPQYSKDDEFIKLLVDEAKLMVFLNHPNIVPLIEFGKVEDSYYIAMDYIEGTTLKGLYQRVREKGEQVPINIVLHVVREVGTGLAYAHRKIDKNGRPLQIVHRDISPSNILISFDGEVKITDFGISKASNQTHRTEIGVIRGKTGYMSPEQTMPAATIDHRSDLYSLGIIFFELLTGTRLYKADNIPEALKLIRKSEIPSVMDLRSQIKPQLEAIVRRVLAADVKDRYQSGEEFVDSINEYLTRYSPGGRAVRVTYTDLVAFMRKYFEDEMEPATRPAIREDFPDAISTASKVDLRTTGTAVYPHSSKAARLQTIAANPLFDMQDSPDSSLSKKMDLPHKSTTIKTSEEVTDAEQLFVGNWLLKGIRNLKKALWILSLLVVGGGAIAFFKFQNQWPGQKVTQVQNLSRVEIMVESDPPGAEIYLNDQLQSVRTPSKLSVPEGKNIKLTLNKPGYKEIFRELRPGPGMLPFHFKLIQAEVPKKSSAKVRINSEPAGADLYVDDVKIDGQTPIDLSIEVGKEIKLRLEAKGFQSKITSLRVDEAKELEKTVWLVRKARQPKTTDKPKIVPMVIPPPPLGGEERTTQLSKLKISTKNPNWAMVFIDGKKVSDQTPFIGEVPAGRHKIMISNPSFNVVPYEQTLEFPLDEEVRCFVDFEAKSGRCETAK